MIFIFFALVGDPFHPRAFFVGMFSLVSRSLRHIKNLAIFIMALDAME